MDELTKWFNKAAELQNEVGRLTRLTDEIKQRQDDLEAENKRLKEEVKTLRGTRKCSCGESIFYYIYCPRCRRQWES